MPDKGHAYKKGTVWRVYLILASVFINMTYLELSPFYFQMGRVDFSVSHSGPHARPSKPVQRLGLLLLSECSGKRNGT